MMISDSFNVRVKIKENHYHHHSLRRETARDCIRIILIIRIFDQSFIIFIHLLFTQVVANRFRSLSSDIKSP